MTYFRRVWSMPNKETFSIEPINELIRRYTAEAIVIVDPFARNSTFATISNDLNPDTTAMHHLDALEFLTMLREGGVQADLVLFDPPYCARQMVECYQGIGLDTGQKSAVMNRTPTQRLGWSVEKHIIAEMQSPGDIVITCGWHSNGMSKKRGYQLIELLLVAHGGSRHDTIVTVEHKICRQERLF